MIRRSAFYAAIFLSSLLLCAGCDRGAQPRELGKMAPAFTIHEGAQAVSLNQFRGQVVLVNFWASWCPPCIDELPSLLALHHRLPQLAILGVSIDADPQAYHDFLQENHIDFLTIRDPSQDVMHRYGTIKIPESYLIDRSGHIVRKYIDAQDWTSPQIVDTLSSVLNAKN